MKHLKTKGFIAIEAVIIAAMVLLAGLSGISLFSQNGGTSLNKLETTFNIVDGGVEAEEQVSTVNLKDGATTITSISVSVPKILDVEILPLTAANQNITASSSNDNVATVSVDSENKRITINRVSAGTVTITVTVDGTSNMLSVTTSPYPASAYQLPWSNTLNYVIFNKGGTLHALATKSPIYFLNNVYYGQHPAQFINNTIDLYKYNAILGQWQLFTTGMQGSSGVSGVSLWTKGDNTFHGTPINEIKGSNTNILSNPTTVLVPQAPFQP